MVSLLPLLCSSHLPFLSVAVDGVLSAFPIYVSELSKTMTLISRANSSLEVEGIKMYEFRLDPVVMLNASDNPYNHYFGMILGQGLINLTLSYSNVPIWMSKPAWLDVISPLTRYVNSTLVPDRQLHDTIVHVEPITGVIMQAFKRLQVNIVFESPLRLSNTTTWFSNLANDQLLLPVGWVQESGQISSSDASSFRKEVYGTQRAVNVIPIVLFTLACIGLGWIMIASMLRPKSNQSDSYRVVNGDEYSAM